MENVLKENNELIKIAREGEEKFKKIREVIQQFNLNKYFQEISEN